MLKKYLFVALLFLLAFPTVSAQSVPGYLGKKTYVDYNLTIPHWLYFVPNPSNLIHNFRLHTILRRRASVALSFDFFSLEGEPEEGTFSDALFSEVKGTALGLSFEWYSKNSIAPLGRYFRIDAKFFRTDYVDKFSGGVEMEGSFTTPYLGFGFGIRRVFFDRMVFNAGGSIGVTLKDFADNAGHKNILLSNNLYQGHLGVGILLR
ncbi:MAG: hypothetical protein AAF573_16365 [Bacteroidota bacterium]